MAVDGGLAERLPCGAGLEPLVGQVFDGQPPADAGHQAECRYCQGALARLSAVQGTISAVAGERVTTPAGLVRSVMERLRSDDADVLVAASVRGALTISERIITQVAVRAALAGEEITYASAVRVERVGVSPLDLRLRLVVLLGPSLPEAADAARDRVRRAVAELAGVPLGRVDVVIDDVA